MSAFFCSLKNCFQSGSERSKASVALTFLRRSLSFAGIVLLTVVGIGFPVVFPGVEGAGGVFTAFFVVAVAADSLIATETFFLSGLFPEALCVLLEAAGSFRSTTDLVLEGASFTVVADFFEATEIFLEVFPLKDVGATFPRLGREGRTLLLFAAPFAETTSRRPDF